MLIHQNLKTLRELCGYTQQEVADSLHMSQNTISKIESGNQKLDIELLVKLADFYKVTPLQLLNNVVAITANETGKSNTGNVEFNEVILMLSNQLKEKDRQIEVLMSIIKNK